MLAEASAGGGGGGGGAASVVGALEMAVSSLDLEVGSAMFLDSRLHLRCAAWLFNVYRRNSVEYELQEDAPQLASVLGPSLSGATTPRPNSGLLAPAAAAVAAAAVAAVLLAAR
ncbi:hypothetical protein R5R35_014652 [Gryllus longicercus]|uniref:Uncharacterized protein n=1 Tax=Gryllus longicercus TaxID=2509291 RepID=A0AAN9Z220_9ORTH